MSPTAALRLGRAEWLAVMAAAFVMLVAHASEVSWARFALVFVAIDLIGFAPMAIMRWASAGRAAPRVCLQLYNLTHNLVTALVAVACWAAYGGFEWAMLAFPLHLAGDRGLFGNGFQVRSHA